MFLIYAINGHLNPPENRIYKMKSHLGKISEYENFVKINKYCITEMAQNFLHLLIIDIRV